MKRVLVTGAAGMLGTALYGTLKGRFDFRGVDKQRPQSESPDFVLCDLTDQQKLRGVFDDFLPAVVIHCAALVSVDDCEKNKDAAYNLHVESTRELSLLAHDEGSHFIYISTDSVFNGQKKIPYNEDDTVAPLNTYARTKLEGEMAALEIDNSLVLRTNIFGWTPARKSFSEWVLDGIVHSRELNMFTDVLYTPISVYCLSDVILKCIEDDVYGLYHAGSNTVLSKYDFAMKVAAEYNLSTVSVNPVSKDKVNLAAARPGNMALNSSKLSRKLHSDMPDIDTSIRRWKENQP